jgi:deoxycytidylate deaminase
MRQDKAIKFLRHAQSFADLFSKDRSTKVGAYFVHASDFSKLAEGYNGFPRGCNDDLEVRHQRPQKYDYTEHAERNAIFNAVRPYLKGAIVVTTEVLTMSSARALISVGAASVYSMVPSSIPGTDPRVAALLDEVGVQHAYHNGKEVLAQDATGKIAKYLQDAQMFVEHHAKDPFACGTLFISGDGDYSILTSGYSGMPRGADDSQEHRYRGDERTYWVEDSMRNAIYNRARPLLRDSVAIVTHEPCSECFRALAAVGCREVIAPPPPADFAERWKEHIARARAMAVELNIKVVNLNPE